VEIHTTMRNIPHDSIPELTGDMTSSNAAIDFLFPETDPNQTK